MRFLGHFVAIAIASLAVNSSATTRFVDVNSTNPVAPYTNWVTAATNIQDAVDASTGIGDTVLVTNGVYRFGGAAGQGSNRVVVGAGLLVQSVNGPAVTTIQGYQVPGTTNGPAAVRCVYIHEFGRLAGFTLTGGATASSGVGEAVNGGGLLTDSQCSINNCIIVGNASASSGGGAFLAGLTGVTNCIIAGNTAPNASGGGVYGANTAALVNCVISNNSAGAGGGVGSCTVYSSLLVGNSAGGGGAAYVSTLDNCTLTGNSSGTLGAADACHLQNSIIYYNANGLYADCYQCQLSNCCTTIGLGTSTLPSGCFSNAPSFVNAAAGDYHLNPWSLCVDAGNNSFTTNSLDLDGNPRIAGAAVDVGAYENQSPFQVTPHYVSLFSTNPVPPYTNWSTAATNIQDAVGVAQAGEFVIVGDGTYTNGGTVLFGSETNRVALTNAITLTSAGGPQAAKIVGGTQMRCVYVGTNSTLIGFTITGGRGRSGGDITNEQSGAGIWCEIGGTVSNCIVVGNFNSGGGPIGGGIFRGAVYNSTIYSNSAAMGAGGALGSYFNCLIVSNAVGFGNFGGGIYGGIASNCTFLANGSYYGVTGGGAYRSTLYNCTLATNFSTYGGGGADSSTLYHCILIGNQSTSEGGGSHLSTNYNCTFVNNSAANGGAVGRGVSYGCLLSNNVAYFGGGGAFQATLTNCVLVGNQTTNTMPFYGGGGTDGGTLFNCLLLSNSAAYYGGGAYQGTLYNCTVVGNTATNSGGTYDSEVYNSIIYYNFATSASNYSGINLQYCCTTPQPFGRSTCFTNAPLFVDLAKIDFHLQSNSPCINSGNNVYITNTVKLATDLDGNPRLISTAVDDGAYEFTSPASILPYSWLWLYGLATDGSADNSDSDGDGMSNYAEWRAGTNPTNVASAVALKNPVVTETNATITWQSVSGVYYYVQRTPDFFAQPFQTIASNIVGPTGTISYTDTNAVAGSVLFYRVGVQ